MNLTDTLPASDTELLTPEQLALKLNISRRCLSNWTRRNIFPMIKIGKTCRFDLQKVRAALEQYEQAATCLPLPPQPQKPARHAPQPGPAALTLAPHCSTAESQETQAAATPALIR